MVCGHSWPHGGGGHPGVMLITLAPAQGRDSAEQGLPGVQGKVGWEYKTATAAPREGTQAGRLADQLRKQLLPAEVTVWRLGLGRVGKEGADDFPDVSGSSNGSEPPLRLQKQSPVQA